MKSVLFTSIMNGAPWGGSEELWYQSALRLAQKNYKVGVCCFNWPEKKEKLDRLREAGCRIFLLPGKNETSSIFGKLKLKKAVFSVPYTEYDTAVLNQGGWKDVAHGPFKQLYKQLPPYALCFYTYDAREKLSSRKKEILNNWITHAVANLTDTGRTFRVLKETFFIDVPRQHIQVNPTTFPAPDSFTDYNSPGDSVIFSMFAEMDISRKAQDVLIKALTLPVWKERKWTLHLYGRGKDKVYLEKLVYDAGLQSKIIFKGFTGDFKKSLAESELVLHMTHREGMPLTVVDAMAVSRPLLVSDVGDMPNWVQQGVNGWITKEVTAEAVNETLELAWNNREKWTEMGRNSFRIFKEKYPNDPVKHFLQMAGIIKDEI